MIGFLCPDINFPSGGTKRLYRHVDVLNKHWPDIASIVHTQENFRLTWFDNDTNIIDKQTFKEQLREDDIVVIPTYCPPQVLDEWNGMKKVHYNLGCYYTFGGHPCPTPKTIFHDLDLVGVVVVSEEDKEFISLMNNDLKIWVVKSGIDTSLFYPEKKEKVITASVRKMEHDVTSAINLARCINKEIFKGWQLKFLDGYSFEEYASALRKSAIHLYLNPPQQGFPGPALEAMACGCRIISYEGTGKNIINELGVGTVLQGDIRGVAKILIGTVCGPSNISHIIGPDYVKNNYSLKAEEKSIIEIWKEILNSLPNSKFS